MRWSEMTGPGNESGAGSSGSAEAPPELVEYMQLQLEIIRSGGRLDSEAKQRRFDELASAPFFRPRACPLCGEEAIYALSYGPERRVRWARGGGPEGVWGGCDIEAANAQIEAAAAAAAVPAASTLATPAAASPECEHDAALEPVAEAQQDTLSDALAHCTLDAR